MNRNEELEIFKRRINLSEYAARLGYLLDRKASSRSSVVMDHPNGDKVVMAVGEGGHWIYFSVRDERDNGTIIDFVQRRQGGSLGDVRKELRRTLDCGYPTPLPSCSYVPTLAPGSKDLIRVRARLEESQVIAGSHPYLEQERKVPRWVLQDARFLDRVRIDARGNAVFPHWNRNGICGFELKNQKFTGFSPGGEKGLWASHTQEGDIELVIAETAIDALSHFALRRPPSARYVSTAGSLNQSQPELIRSAAMRLADGGRVVFALDNDVGGDAIADSIRSTLAPLPHVQIVEDRPARRGTDWNDALKDSYRITLLLSYLIILLQ